MQSFGDWLDFHGLDLRVVQDVIAAHRCGQVQDAPGTHADGLSQSVRDSGKTGTRSEVLSDIVIPALATFLGKSTDVRGLMHRVEFTEPVGTGNMSPPYTADLGKGQAPRVEMAWHGTIDDVICLAHEAAHALQILLSSHETMPPVVRETCAFLGELAVIEHARNRLPGLFGALCDVWRKENETYLGQDLEALSRAVADPSTPYHYRQNYPIARLAAVKMFGRGGGGRVLDLFAAGGAGMCHLPIADMADRAGEIANHLPPLPDSHPERPEIDAYRSLGAMALIDIDFWQGESEKRIGEYYARLLQHIRDQTAFLAFDEQRRPIGYATWLKSSQSGNVTLTRQAAPFGDHLALQRTLERYLGREAGVSSYHDRSARKEQPAW